MLTLDYRPARFADLVGQAPARAILQSMVAIGTLPPAFIFRGGAGTGKTSAARILAAALNCPQVIKGDCCTDCESCRRIRAGRSLSVHEIDAASHGGVEEIRALRELVQYAADSPWRVVILDEVHALSKQAFNALLKVLEEPPARTVFCLLTTEVDKIPRTVQSRAMPVQFGPIPVDAILERLRYIRDLEQLSITDELLTEIADLSDGGLRGAVVLLDQARTVRVTKVAQLHALLGISTAPAQIIEAVLAGDLDQAHDEVTAYFRNSASIADFVAGLIKDLHYRYALRQITHTQLFAAAKLLWSARGLGPSTDRNSRAQISALVTVLFTVLAPAAEQPILRATNQTEAS